ncbi:MAG: endolytic transglycosylase MltG [Nitrospirota bacterium]|nr:MAG: endolytic transglycosylase MltG [Nitrospirota bacterium]
MTSRVFRFAIISVVSSFFLYLLLQLYLPLPSEKLDVEIEVKKGMSTAAVLKELDDKGLVRDRKLMLILLKITGADKKIKAGYYSFTDSGSQSGIIAKLLKGKVIMNDVTILEGETIWRAADRLRDAGIMGTDEFFSYNNNYEFLRSMNINAPSLEGYLYPETYRFPKGAKPGDVIRHMVWMMRQKFTEDMVARMKEIELNEREVLTLASIIEKEAVVDLERPLVSAVYHNRLKKRMRLEADPTSIYGIKDYSEGVTRYDIRRNTPYNTYRRRGLPPGPIAAPSIKSIIAALYPADVPYLFFVSKNNGEHFFSSNIRDHFNAVNRYRSLKERSRKDNNG